MSQLSGFEKVFVHIVKNIPKNNVLNGLLMFLRVIPLFLITHDWNIHYKNSITYYISYYTTLPIIHKKNVKNISLGIILTLFIYSIFNIFIFLKFFKQIKDYNKVSHRKFFKYGIQIIYIINFIFAPYNFMFCVENYFCDPIYDENVSYKLIKNVKKDCINPQNIVIMIIQSILFIYLFILNIIFTCITAKPCCFTSSFIITKLNEIKYKLVFFPLFQSILVIDYYLPLKICVLIKCSIRGLYMWYYIKFMTRETKNFYTNNLFRLSIIFIDSMCFFSCIIEYIFLYDWNNNLEALQKNLTIIIFKLLTEGALSFVVIQIFCEKEKKLTLQVFNGEFSSNYSYELLNKIFYIFYHPEKKFGNDLLYEIVEHFDMIFKIHKSEKKCINYPGIKCFCSKYSYNDFVKQSELFLEAVNNIRIGYKCNHKILKNDFPIMYKYIKNFLKIQLIKNKGNSENESYLLILSYFYSMFDKNYNKSLFYLEEFSMTKLFKTNKLIRLQIKLIKLIIFEDYQNHLIYTPLKSSVVNKKNSFLDIYKIFSKISEIIIIENLLSKVLDFYIEALEICKNKDCTFDEFAKIMKKFKKLIHKMNKTLISLFMSNIVTSYHLCAKLTIFYSFFYLELPKNINKCFKNIFEITCQYENYSTIIVSTIINKNSWKFPIEYVSDNFCSKLGYTLNEMKNKEIKLFTPENFHSCYDYCTLEKIRTGNVQLIFKELIFLNKKNQAMLFNSIGIIVFDGDKLKLFFKVYPYNFQDISGIKNIHSKKKDKNYEMEEIFTIINKKGKIYAISKLFEKYFCLDLYSIKKYKLNFFKDILKIENIENRDIIKISLNQVYENIYSIKFNLTQNSSNEDFSESSKKIKDYQKNLVKNLNAKLICFIHKKVIPKNNKDIKKYYFIFFGIESKGDYVTFEYFLGYSNAIHKYFIFPSKTKVGDFVNGLNKKNKKILSKKFQLNKNQNEVLIKIRQIQILSIKNLMLNFNIPIHDILDLTLKEEQEFNNYNNIVEKETSRLITNSVSSTVSLKSKRNSLNTIESIDNIDKFFRNRAIEEPYVLSKKINYSYCLKIKVYILIFIWLLLTILFIILQIITICMTNKQSKKVSILTDILINSLMTRNIIYSFINNLINMQYIANGLQGEIIDNGFTNTISFHKKKIYDRLRDFLYYFKLFERQEKYLIDYGQIDVINIIFQELDYVSAKRENLTIKHSLSSILAMSHLHAYQVIESEIEPFIFNISYYNIENRNLLGESAFFQFVFDNYFCNGKYAWDEVDNLIYFHIEQNTNKMLIMIYLISIFSGILVCGFFVFQSFFYVKFNNHIYAKYYINYNYLQFFNTLLLKKGNSIKDFISNTDIERLYKFSQNKIPFQDKIEDDHFFKSNYIRLNNKMPLLIKSYKIKDFILQDNFKLGISRTNTIYMTPRNKNDSISFTTDINKNNINFMTYAKKNMSKFSKVPTEDINGTGINKKQIYKKSKKTTKRNSNAWNNNTSTNNILLNQSKNPLELLTEFNQFQSKKDLQATKQLTLYSIFFSISIIFLSILFLLNDLIIKKTLDTRIFFTFIIKSLIETVITGQELFNIYAISLLKGEVITFNYTSHGYLNAFKELDYINDLEEHNIMEEQIAKYELSLIKVFPIFSEKINLVKSLTSYLFQVDSPGGCEFYTNFYYENKNYYDFSFLNAFDYEPSELIQQCNNISFGINKQGVTSSSQNLLNSIIVLYSEFKNDNNKEENLMNRITNEKFVGMWLEIDLIYDKIIINLIICWNKDLKNKENEFDNLNYFISALIMIFIIIIFIAYLIFFPFKTLRDNSTINKVEPCIYNTIMF